MIGRGNALESIQSLQILQHAPHDSRINVEYISGVKIPTPMPQAKSIVRSYLNVNKMHVKFMPIRPRRNSRSFPPPFQHMSLDICKGLY
jgi:hypothetical protein